MIKINEVSFKKNNNLILDKITFKIDEGNFIVIYGQNGAGKTTLAKIISGFYKYDEGEYYFKGELIDSREKLDLLNKHIHFVFQNIDNQFVYDVVKRDLAFGMENQQIPYDEMKQRVDQAKLKYNLEHLEERKIFQLSGGEKQKVAIATSWIDDKEIIIFDESIAMLDPKNLNDFWKMLSQLKKENKTVILITHSVNIPLEFDWKFLFIKNKKVETYESAQSFFEQNIDNINEIWIKKIIKFQLQNKFTLTLEPEKIVEQIREVVNNGESTKD